MKTQVLRGKLEPLGLVKVLAYICNFRETGYLKIRQKDVEKTLIIKSGQIIFAKSNLPMDRLGDMLLNEGKITQEQFGQASALLEEKGFRHGRSLVEIKAITPKLLWETIEKQIRNIAYSVTPWEEGEFEFVRQGLKVKEKITLRLPILGIVMDVVRHYDKRELFLHKFPDLEAIPEVNEIPSSDIELHAHEQHILDLIDGKIPLKELCELADFGMEEGLRTVFLLQVLGIIEIFSNNKDPDTVRRIHMIERYNQTFGYIHKFLSQQMGHVAHNLLKKYFHDIQESHDAVFGMLDLDNDGKLNSTKILSNLDKAPVEEDFLDGILQEALEEYLYSAILAIKRALGTELETIAVQHIEEIQSQW